MMSFFSIRQTECGKLQYGRELPAKIFKARIEEMIQNDQRVTLSEISPELGLSYGCVQHIVFLMGCDILRQCCENILRDLALWTGDLVPTKMG
ncbi:hypothetical protein TNCV_3325911 [Trichonephila clavipes]|nr:hypothetical protein TNCV_3325911 [Trichonephila clavipes]